MSYIFLVGFMGAGKTTLAKKLAKKLAYTWLDTDQEIEKKEGMKVSEIFEVRGEAYFRALEPRVLSPTKLEAYFFEASKILPSRSLSSLARRSRSSFFSVFNSFSAEAKDDLAFAISLFKTALSRINKAVLSVTTDCDASTRCLLVEN